MSTDSETDLRSQPVNDDVSDDSSLYLPNHTALLGDVQTMSVAESLHDRQVIVVT